MKVLSLKQPWASLVVMGAKKWETRSWKPSLAMKYLLNTYGMLIHASAKFDREDKFRCCNGPFSKYVFDYDNLHTGCIIGHVGVGRIITTRDWKIEFEPVIHPTVNEEYSFGDYSPDRWAWELLNPVLFDKPIPAKGSLSIWEFDEDFPDVFTKRGEVTP